MKSSRLPVILATFFVAVVFFAACRLDALASAEDQIEQAIAVSKNWVAQIDEGKYEESYSAACSEMHDKTPEDRWVMVLKALRKPWGPVLSRTQLSHIYKPNGANDLNGECMVITYDTTFKNLAPATEVVTLKWQDGRWRGAGYTAGPKVSDDESASAPEAPNATETQTQAHFKPVTQQ